MTQDYVNSLGLLLDIAGVALIWIFSLGQPQFVTNSRGEDFKIFSGDPRKTKLHQRLDRIGFLFLIIGFFFQLISNLIPMN